MNRRRRTLIIFRHSSGRFLVGMGDANVARFYECFFEDRVDLHGYTGWVVRRRVLVNSIFRGCVRDDVVADLGSDLVPGRRNSAHSDQLLARYVQENLVKKLISRKDSRRSLVDRCCLRWLIECVRDGGHTDRVELARCVSFTQVAAGMHEGGLHDTQTM
jgi:hypothetical protein